MADDEMQEQFTDEEIENLSDAEREALGANEDADNGTPESEVDDESNAAADDGSTGTDAEDEPKAEVEVEAELEPESEAQTPAVTEQEDEVAATNEAALEASTAEAEPEPDVIPNERMTEIDSAIEGLGAKVEDGDIDFKEYNTELAKLNNERQGLVVQIRDDENAAAQRATDWNASVNTFIESNEGHKLILTNPIIQQAFNTALKQVAGTPEGQAANDGWRLNKAKEVMAEAGIAMGIPKKEAPKDPDGKKPKSRKPTAVIPVTTGDVPAAGANVDTSEFSNLQGLDGMDLENALAKLSPEQEKRYLEG